MSANRRPRKTRKTAYFWALVDQSDGPDACWPWTGTKGPLQAGQRYGRVKARGLFGPSPQRAHRVAFWLVHGRWPEPECMHSCDNYPCCNPAHLGEGTHRQNMQDASRRERWRRNAPHKGV